jgi:hypothetical protein
VTLLQRAAGQLRQELPRVREAGLRGRGYQRRPARPQHGDGREARPPLAPRPTGDLIKRLDLWNGKEGVSEPAVVVVDRSGVVRRLYSGGTDFSDCPPEEVLMETLEEVGASDEETTEGGEPEVRVSAEEADRETMRPDKPPWRSRSSGPTTWGHLLRDGRDATEARRRD